MDNRARRGQTIKFSGIIKASQEGMPDCHTFKTVWDYVLGKPDMVTCTNIAKLQVGAPTWAGAVAQ
jgi:hypothetical protein